jgi:seryl-tRNA synthetase
VSVGLQRLREEPDLLRRAAADKGEDPALVDRALDLAEQRRVHVAELDAAKARRNSVSEQIAEAVRAGSDPASQDLRRLKDVSRLESAGIKLPSNLFQERVLLRD